MIVDQTDIILRLFFKMPSINLIFKAEHNLRKIMKTTLLPTVLVKLKVRKTHIIKMDYFMSDLLLS